MPLRNINGPEQQIHIPISPDLGQFSTKNVDIFLISLISAAMKIQDIRGLVNDEFW